jgi:hypothetical protein
MWRELISSARHVDPDVRLVFHPGATPAQILVAERELGGKIPLQLRELLAEANGASEELKLRSGDWEDIGFVLWPVEWIVRETLGFREEPAWPRGGVAFAGAGCDLITFLLSNGVVRTWYPIEADAPRCADDLADWAVRWFGGKLGV